MEKSYRRVYQLPDLVMCKSNKTFHTIHRQGLVREIVRTKPPTHIRTNGSRRMPDLSLGADVNPSIPGSVRRDSPRVMSCQDPRSIFGSDHQKANIKNSLEAPLSDQASSDCDSISVTGVTIRTTSSSSLSHRLQGFRHKITNMTREYPTFVIGGSAHLLG
jgi:hypothetical protein